VHELIPNIPNSELLTIRKPSQYVGGELNSVQKELSTVTGRIALCFPDGYEIGMSHLGLQILYSIINNIPEYYAERAFMPFADMEELLRKNKTYLYTLETKTSLKDFPLIGFSLQYELCHTNVLAMLELGGITLRSKNRGEDEPLVIGGGPNAFHPSPLVPFFDAFYLGDAEDNIVKLVECANSKKLSRFERLTRLSEIDGVYVPSIHQYPIVRKKHFISELNNQAIQLKPIVPNTNIVHNRLAIEVSRGCLRGCRFCQAGYLYRPQRERNIANVISNLKTAVRNSGYDDISLLSLSTADHTSIIPLSKAVMDTFAQDEKISISIPSTRVDAISLELLEQVKRVRRTNFTIAPEAGTQRLRDVINKCVTEEQILEACSRVFLMGWSSIKLYFILGLPTETDDDLNGIIELARSIKKLPEAKGKEITVSVSTFVPKPHTPFQWCEQITMEETERRQNILKNGLSKLKVQFRTHGAFSSFLEGVFCRGDERLAEVIEVAYKSGARFDAWDKKGTETLWCEAFSKCWIEPHDYLKSRVEAASNRFIFETCSLPWDNIDIGVSKKFLISEYEKSLTGKTTLSCLHARCNGCGVCDFKTVKNELSFCSEIVEPSPVKKLEPTLATHRYRIKYAKLNELSFLSHLELMQVIIRAVHRAQLPVSYSNGFHPKPQIAFSPALPLGVESESEFLDLKLTKSVSIDEIKTVLGKALPKSLEILEVVEIPLNSLSLQAGIKSLTYQVSVNGKNATQFLADPLPTAIVRYRENGEVEKNFNFNEHITNIKEMGSSVAFTIKCEQSKAQPRPIEVVAALFNCTEEITLRKL